MNKEDFKKLRLLFYKHIPYNKENDMLFQKLCDLEDKII